MAKETKRERFIRVAEKRTQKILDMMRLLGNCANKNNYEYTKADVDKIINAIEQELDILKLKFKGADYYKSDFRL